MENDVNSRLKSFLKSQGITQKRFCEDIGLSIDTLKTTFQRNSDISIETISNTIQKYPSLNIEWLLTGEGLMLKEDDFSVKQLYSPIIKDGVQGAPIPLYDIDAAANLKTMFESKTQNIIGVLSIPNMPKADGAMFVRGDSMYPILKAGDIIVFKILNDLSFVIPGEMYVISYTWDDDEYVVVKYVNKSEIPDHYKLVSYNQHFEPMDIPINTIRAMALVKVSVRYNTVK